eukprot:1840788-Rhodomonas_salina.4
MRSGILCWWEGWYTHHVGLVRYVSVRAGMDYVSLVLAEVSIRGGVALMSSAIGLRACYAMSSTGAVSGDISRRACYARSGTDILHGAMSGTGIACDITPAARCSLEFCPAWPGVRKARAA